MGYHTAMLSKSGQAGGLRLLALAVIFLLPMMSLALAGEPGKTADPAKAAALAHFETARRLYEVREYAKALEEYKAAYVAKPDPAFLFNIGQCHRKLGQNAQALDFFQQYLKKAPPDDPNRPQVEARIADIQAEEQAKVPRVPETRPLPVPPEPLSPAAAPAPLPTPLAIETAPVPSPAPPPSAGTDVSLTAQPAPAVEQKPIYVTWWFWTGVGAVVVAGAVTTAYLMSSGGGTKIPSTPMGNRPVFP